MTGEQVTDDQRVYMLNIIWFHPEGGKDRYRKYLASAESLFISHGGKKLDSFIPQEAVIGDFDADLIFTTEWPSIDHFRAFVADPAFEPLRALRESAISKSLLVRCRRRD